MAAHPARLGDLGSECSMAKNSTKSETSINSATSDDAENQPIVGSDAPQKHTHQDGAVSIAPASATQKMPDWPEIAMEIAPDPGQRACLIGNSERREITVICDHDGRFEKITASAADSWASHIVKLGVTAVCIYDHGMFRTKPSLASNVDDLVQLGMQVVVITENPEDEFNLVACLSHLKPHLLMHHVVPSEEIWRALQAQTGHTLDAYRSMIEIICDCHPALVHLFLTALCHAREGKTVTTTTVIDSLVDTITHVVCTEFVQSHDQAIFLSYLALQGDPTTTIKVRQSLGSTSQNTHFAQRMVLAISSESVPPELRVTLWQRLRAHIDTEAFEAARQVLIPLLGSGLTDDVNHLGLLELFTGDTSSCLTLEISDLLRQAVDAADTKGKKRIMRALPQFIKDGSVEKAAARIAVICSDTDLNAFGVALKALDTANTMPDTAYDVFSPLAVLEYPALSAHLAERVIETLDPDDPRIVKAVLSWIISSPATACSAPARRWHILRRIVAISHSDLPSASIIRAGIASLRAFTRRSASVYLHDLATQQGLSSEGLPLIACCLAGLATCMNNMTDEAAIWCWRARALANPRDMDYTWVLIVQSLVAFHRRNITLTNELLSRVAKNSALTHAPTLYQFCKLAMQYLNKGYDTSGLIPVFTKDIHPILRAFATYCSANMNHRKGNVQKAIDKHFTTGRILASAKLTNPFILDWRQRLQTIFVACHEEAIAKCLQNDIYAAEETWSSINNTSDSCIGHSDTGLNDDDRLQKLSISEQRVAEQIASGCTNAQAASALYLSKRTVDTHLRNIYRRLGISNRADLIRIVKTNHPESDQGSTTLERTDKD